MGNVWEMFGKCLELSYTDYQVVNMVSWEMFGKCLGNVWEFEAIKKKEDEKKIKKKV